jgi:hypothetical protein
MGRIFHPAFVDGEDIPGFGLLLDRVEEFGGGL